MDPAVPAREWRLSDEGRRRAEILAGRLSAYEARRVVSSREPKASETAAIIGAHLRLSSEVVEGLQEHDREGVGFLEAAVLRAAVERLFREPAAAALGRETGGQALRRFSEAIDGVMWPDAGACIAVTHGTVMCLYIESVTGLDGFALWQTIGHPAYAVIDLEGRELREVDDGAGLIA